MNWNRFMCETKKEFIQIPYKIDTIFIMLGFACNFNCKYCLQYKNKTHEVITSFNEEIIDFIRYQASINEHIRINFYGGEPLLYIDTIRKIVSSLHNIENIHFSLITNGSLLDKDIIDFIFKFLLNFSFTLGISGTSAGA